MLQHDETEGQGTGARHKGHILYDSIYGNVQNRQIHKHRKEMRGLGTGRWGGWLMGVRFLEGDENMDERAHPSDGDLIHQKF